MFPNFRGYKVIGHLPIQLKFVLTLHMFSLLRKVLLSCERLEIKKNYYIVLYYIWFMYVNGQ